MSKVDLTPPILDLNLYAGDGSDIQLKFQTPAGALINVSDRTFTAQIRKSRAATTAQNIQVITTSAATGIIVLHIPATVTAVLAKVSQWDLQCTSVSRPDPFTILQGTVNCSPDVTH